RRGRGRTRRQGATAKEDGHGLGCRQRSAVPGFRRGQLHHRHDVAGGRRRERAEGLAVANTARKKKCKQMAKPVERDNMLIEWDVEIVMDDGAPLRADVFRPKAEGKWPVLLTYG